MPIQNMMRTFQVAALLIGLLSTVAVAQGPGRGQGGPGGGGRMMGMGMGGGASGLLMMKEVREELKLDEDQVAELEDLNKAIRESFSGMRPPQGGQPDPQAMQEAMEKMRKATADAEAKLADILDPTQLERLIGLIIQRDNVRSVNSKIVAEKLEITEEQKAKFAELEKENMEKMREMFQGGGFSPEMRDKMRTLREEADAKLKDVLTAKQKDLMESLKGAEFKFPEPQFGRGGPGGGPGGGQGGGRGRRGGGDGGGA